MYSQFEITLRIISFEVKIIYSGNYTTMKTRRIVGRYIVKKNKGITRSNNKSVPISTPWSWGLMNFPDRAFKWSKLKIASFPFDTYVIQKTIILKRYSEESHFSDLNFLQFWLTISFSFFIVISSLKTPFQTSFTSKVAKKHFKFVWILYTHY